MLKILFHKHIKGWFIVSKVLFWSFFYAICIVYCIFISEVFLVVYVVFFFLDVFLSSCGLIERLTPTEPFNFLEKLDLFTEDLYIFSGNLCEFILIRVTNGFDSFESSLIFSV